MNGGGIPQCLASPASSSPGRIPARIVQCKRPNVNPNVQTGSDRLIKQVVGDGLHTLRPLPPRSAQCRGARPSLPRSARGHSEAWRPSRERPAADTIDAPAGNGQLRPDETTQADEHWPSAISTTSTRLRRRRPAPSMVTPASAIVVTTSRRRRMRRRFPPGLGVGGMLAAVAVARRARRWWSAARPERRRADRYGPGVDVADLDRRRSDRIDACADSVRRLRQRR